LFNEFIGTQLKTAAFYLRVAVPHGSYRSEFGVRRVKAAFLSGCKSHPAILLQPEAIGAVMEVTKWLKPSV